MFRIRTPALRALLRGAVVVGYTPAGYSKSHAPIPADVVLEAIHYDFQSMSLLVQARSEAFSDIPHAGILPECSLVYQEPRP